MPPGSPHYVSRNDPRALTSTMASDPGERERDQEEGAAQTEAVVPPVPSLPPVQFWLPGFPVYRVNGRSMSVEDDYSKDDGR
jgi:hypothetical protein